MAAQASFDFFLLPEVLFLHPPKLQMPATRPLGFLVSSDIPVTGEHAVQCDFPQEKQ